MAWVRKAKRKPVLLYHSLCTLFLPPSRQASELSLRAPGAPKLSRRKKEKAAHSGVFFITFRAPCFEIWLSMLPFDKRRRQSPPLL